MISFKYPRKLTGENLRYAKRALHHEAEVALITAIEATSPGAAYKYAAESLRYTAAYWAVCGAVITAMPHSSAVRAIENQAKGIVDAYVSGGWKHRTVAEGPAS